MLLSYVILFTPKGLPKTITSLKMIRLLRETAFSSLLFDI